MAYKVKPIEGVIYLYRDKPGKNLYVGQTSNWERRHRDHFTKSSLTTDRQLLEIGEENIDVIILHKKTFNEFQDSAKNRDAYQTWANELEISEIQKYDTYKNGLNKTKGGQHDNRQDAFIEHAHKKSLEFFEKFIKAAKIYNEKEDNILGACPRNYVVEEMDGYSLGEDLHKFRCNGYATIWADKECVDLLNEVGYTHTSEEAGVDFHKRGGDSRIKNKLPKILKVLDWIYDKYDHVNVPQGSENPDKFPLELLEGLNYGKISQLIYDMRKKGNKTFGDLREFYANKYKFFDTDDDFMTHKFIVGMEWYYAHERFSHPQQSYVIPEISNLPKYMKLLNLGILFSNRKSNGNIPKDVLVLVEKNKHKPRPTQKDNWEKNPEKKELMAAKVKEAMKSKTPLYYKLRSWNGILKQSFEHVDKEADLKKPSGVSKVSKAYFVSQQHFTSGASKSPNKYFTVSLYETLNECYLDARRHKIRCFYARKWYIKTFIKKLHDAYKQEAPTLTKEE
jgi:hypothetical protein